ncbi:MAG: alanine racemase [Streptosporangiales bacterium]|nr:alanine racemase [Streptosporangiales bacterium]
METLAEARVDLAAVRANVATLGEHAPGAQVLAAVKADGYGHGMVQVARAALQGGATWLGCAYVEEALALRAAGIGARVLAWIVPPGQPLTAALRAGVDLAVGARWLVDDIAAAAREAGRPARVHLKADTGLSRGGATPAEWAPLVDAALAAQAEGLIDVVGVMSHLARADEPGDPSIAAQIGHFRDAVELAEKAGVRPEVRHLCNSAGTLSLPEAHFDLVRPGISVYGLSPFAPTELARPEAYGLRPAMTLSAQVAMVKRVPEGSGVSYGHRYVTGRESTLALIPVGYGDGIPRAATNTADVLLAGRRRRIAGTVCMDQFVLDVGDDDVRAGDRAVLFGPGDHGEPTAQDWAAALGTISWEIVTRVGARVPRVYEGSV